MAKENDDNLRKNFRSKDSGDKDEQEIHKGRHNHRNHPHHQKQLVEKIKSPRSKNSRSKDVDSVSELSTSTADESDLDTHCVICGSDSSPDKNPIVLCDGEECDMPVHQDCYGIPIIPPGDEEWFCQRCEDKVKVLDTDGICCPIQWGAFKRTTKANKYVHVTCVAYHNTIDISRESIKIPQSLIDQNECCICKKKMGLVVPCNESTCKKYLHVMCAVDEDIADLIPLNRIKRATMICPDHYKLSKSSDKNVELPKKRSRINSSDFEAGSSDSESIKNALDEDEYVTDIEPSNSKPLLSPSSEEGEITHRAKKMKSSSTRAMKDNAPTSRMKPTSSSSSQRASLGGGTSDINRAPTSKLSDSRGKANLMNSSAMKQLKMFNVSFIFVFGALYITFVLLICIYRNYDTYLHFISEKIEALKTSLSELESIPLELKKIRPPNNRDVAEARSSPLDSLLDSSFDDLSSMLDEKRKEVETLKSQITDLQTEISTLKEENRQLRTNCNSVAASTGTDQLQTVLKDLEIIFSFLRLPHLQSSPSTGNMIQFISSLRSMVDKAKYMKR